MTEFIKKSHVTIFLVAINIAIFILETIMGGSENLTVAVKFGAFYAPYVLEKHEWYRLITSVFLHFGAEHIGSNMISLIALGPYVEKLFGKLSFTVIYLFSGLCGNLLTLFIDIGTGESVLSAGASGAICGLLGSIVFLSLIPRYRKVFPVKNAGMAVLCMLASGTAGVSVNIYAHIGGLIGGFIMSAILYFLVFTKHKRNCQCR